MITRNHGRLLRAAAAMPPHRARMVVGAILARRQALADEPVSQAAAAFESDMRPVCAAVVSALQAGDIASLQGLRGLLPHLLAEVNQSPALAEVLALQMGRALVAGLTGHDVTAKISGRDGQDGKSSGSGKKTASTGRCNGLQGVREPDGEGELRGGNGTWDESRHPRGAQGRFAAAAIKANIQHGRNAMRRAYSDETDVLSAMSRAEVGEIDFLWDHKGLGIRHIIQRRQEQDERRPGMNRLDVYELLDRVPEIIALGRVANPGSKADTVEIEHEGIRVLLAKRNGKTGSAWVMSGFEISPESQRKGKN